MADHVVDEMTVLETVRALEATDEPLNPVEWIALQDRRLRETVNQRLAGLGRQLIEVTNGEGGRVVGYLSGWSDQAASVLKEDESDLAAEDLAVLTMIYLRTTLLEGLFGEQVASVQDHLNAHQGPDGRDIISAEQLSESLRILRGRQLLDGRGRPGPALLRLSVAQRKRLEENLVLLCRPDSTWAREIRANRQPGEAVELHP